MYVQSYLVYSIKFFFQISTVQTNACGFFSRVLNRGGSRLLITVKSKSNFKKNSKKSYYYYYPHDGLHRESGSPENVRVSEPIIFGNNVFEDRLFLPTKYRRTKRFFPVNTSPNTRFPTRDFWSVGNDVFPPIVFPTKRRANKYVAECLFSEKIRRKKHLPLPPSVVRSRQAKVDLGS